MRVQGYRSGAVRTFLLHLLVFSAFIGIFLSPFHAEGADTATLIVKLPDTLSMEEQAQVIATDGGVQTSSIPALRLHIVTVPAVDLPLILQNYQNDPQVVSVEVGKSRRAEGFSNDTEAGVQWALGKIGWNELFGAVTPTGTARIALLDTGVEASHPDLNGDDLIGPVIPGKSMLVNGENGMTDPNGHGTALAGIVAAVANNGLGIAGVAYQGVSVMPVTVLNASGIGQDSDIIAGIVWAADNGADVILMGFSNQEYSPSLQDAIDYAWSKGAVLVAATGNGSSTAPTYPAGCRGVIGVSATDQTDLLAVGSNYGASVFLAAPGANIFTTALGGAYSDLSGTSASSAIVAAVAGFMKASGTSLSNGVIVERLARTADAAGAASDPENQAKFGNGRVNMARAVADTSTDAIQPAGVAPPASGGPYVGPYLAAATVTKISIAPPSGNPTYGSGGEVKYQVTISVQGRGNYETVLSVIDLPENVIGTLSPSSLSDKDDSKTSTLTLKPGPSVAAGSYTFTVRASLNAGESPTYVTATGTLTVDAAPLSIKADDRTTNYGEETTFGTDTRHFTATGLVNGDTITTVDLSCDGGSPTAPPGTYTISAGNATGTFNPKNYIITYQDGTLTVVGKTTATVTLSNLNQVYTGQALTPSATTDPPGLSVTWTNASQVNAGRYEVTATVDDTNYAGSASGTFTIDPAPQTITFAALVDKKYDAGPFTLSAEAPLPVNFQSLTASVCTVSGNEVIIAGVGTCTIEATQPGNANFSAATPVRQSFTVAAGALHHFDVAIDANVKTALKPFAVTVTALDAGGNTIRDFTGTANLSTMAGPITPSAIDTFLNGVWSGAVTVTGAGQGLTITAAGSGGSGTSTPFDVAKASQTIVVGTVSAKTYGDPTFAVTAQGGGSPNPVVFAAAPAGVCEVSGATVTIKGAGRCVLTASQSGNDTYEPAQDVWVSFDVNKATPTITFDQILNKTTGDPPFALSATSSSGQPVLFQLISGPARLNVENNMTMVTIMDTGTIRVHAYLTESANYNAAFVDQLIEVRPPLTKCAAPGVPIVPAASTGAVYIRWTASSTPNVTYVVERKMVGESTWSQPVYSGTRTDATIIVPAGGDYTFRVKATRSDLGASDYSTGATVCSVAIGPPRSLTVPAGSNGSIFITWGTSATAGSTYYLEQSTDGQDWINVYTGTSTSRSVIVDAQGEYLFRVKAFKAGFDYSGYTTAPACNVTLGVPTNLVVPASSNGTIFISWKASATPGAAYFLQQSIDGENWSEVSTGTITAKTVIVPAQGSYFFRVKAVKDNFEPVYSATATCSVTLGAPSDLVAPASSSGGVFIYWKASATPGAEYELQKSSDGSAWVPAYTGPGTKATVIINTSGSYYFRVRATHPNFNVSEVWAISSVCNVTVP